MVREVPLKLHLQPDKEESRKLRDSLKKNGEAYVKGIMPATAPKTARERAAEDMKKFFGMGDANYNNIPTKGTQKSKGTKSKSTKIPQNLIGGMDKNGKLTKGATDELNKVLHSKGVKASLPYGLDANDASKKFTSIYNVYDNLNLMNKNKNINHTTTHNKKVISNNNQRSIRRNFSNKLPDKNISAVNKLQQSVSAGKAKALEELRKQYPSLSDGQLMLILNNINATNPVIN